MLQVIAFRNNTHLDMGKTFPAVLSSAWQVTRWHKYSQHSFKVLVVFMERLHTLLVSPCPHRKKSNGFRSGDHAGHSMELPNPMIRCWNVSRMYFVTCYCAVGHGRIEAKHSG
ncbi:hypothetical protein TNCV_4899121 [Trichonephila clavipes]|nr:hypothetical protein TNCV_4899121 [Trichonephila clavipes]